MKPWLSRKLWYSTIGALFTLGALAIVGYFKIGDLTGAAAVAGIAAGFGLSVHAQGKKDMLPESK